MRRFGKARKKLLLERFAALGRILRRGQVVAKPAGLFCAGHPDVEPQSQAPSRVDVPRNPKGWRSSIYGPALHESERRKRWIVEPDPEPKRELKIKWHRSPLTKLAELPLAKLPKLPRKYRWQA